MYFCSFKMSPLLHVMVIIMKIIIIMGGYVVVYQVVREGEAGLRSAG